MDAEDWKKLKPEVIVLSPEHYATFIRRINEHPRPNKALIDLLRRKPIWEK